MNSAAMSAILKSNAFQRCTPRERADWALKSYKYRAQRTPGRVPPLTVRVIAIGAYKRLYVLTMRKSYLAAYSVDGLFKKLVLGGWRRMDTCKGPARRAFR